MGRTILAALLATIAICGCANVPSSPPPSSGYDGMGARPYRYHYDSTVKTKPTYTDSYIVPVPRHGAKVIVEKRYSPRPRDQ